MGYETVELMIAERVATLTLARPDRLNALTPTMFAEAGRAIDEAVAAGARALVITGAGRAFCAGADLQARGDEGLPDDLGRIVDDAYNPFARKLADLDIPVVTAINGAAAGAGCSIALMGDISVMARGAYLLLAFVKIGLVPDAGASWLIAKGAGRVRALEMALLGERMPAVEALSAGLVTRVVDDGDVLSTAMEIARTLAAGPTVAIGLIRKQIAHALSSTFDETLQRERDNQSAAGRTADFAGAVSAFNEKRQPAFEGR